MAGNDFSFANLIFIGAILLLIFYSQDIAILEYAKVLITKNFLLFLIALTVLIWWLKDGKKI